MPIAINFLAAIANTDANHPLDFKRVVAVECYLYAFILSFAAVADSLGDEIQARRELAGGFLCWAFAAGVGDLMILVDHLANHPLLAEPLRIASVFVVVGVFICYAWFKLFTLHAALAEHPSEIKPPELRRTGA